jgi:hypothetical protein
LALSANNVNLIQFAGKSRGDIKIFFGAREIIIPDRAGCRKANPKKPALGKAGI